MAVNYRTSLKTTRMTDVVTDIGTTGKLEICSAGYAAILAVIALDNPAGTVTTDTLTLFSAPKSDTSADNSGTAAVARVRTGADADVITGLTVGTSGANVILGSVTIVAGQTVTLNSATIQHSA